MTGSHMFRLKQARSLRTRRKALWFAMVTALSFGEAQAQLPTGAQVVHGTAGIATVGSRMTVTNSPNAILNWQSFSIGAGAAVNFAQQSAASAVLNRVVGQDPSQILGQLTSNGRVFLINPNGILFGQGSRIDVAGLVASTLNITDANFLANRLDFVGLPGAPAGTLLNQGAITTPSGGQVYLIGNSVDNEGIITSPKGEVILAAGTSATLVDTGTPNVSVTLIATDNQALNVGQVVTQGGSANIYGALVRNTGIISASSAVSEGGRVMLKASKGIGVGPDARVGAGGTAGGNIRFDAPSIVVEGDVEARGNQGPGGQIGIIATTTYLDGTLDASSSGGDGGRIEVATGKFEGMAGGELRADSTQANGGDIRLAGQGTVGFSSTFSAAGAQSGGRIELTGDSLYLLAPRIDASGGSQGGSVHLGGGWQGSGSLPHARNVFVGLGSQVEASGLAAGAGGGEIVLWSTQASDLHGRLNASGGEGGVGGRIEFSSKGIITQGANGELKVGAGGTVLLDPKNLIITDTPPSNLALARKVTSGSVGGAMPALSNSDGFGLSVALDGDRLAVGAGGDDTGGNSRGAVHLFTGVGADFSGLTWRKKLASGQGAISMPTLADGDSLGGAVALDGDRLAVGAIGDDTGISNSGAVHLFSGVGSDFSGLIWRRKLASGTGATSMPSFTGSDYFGYALALDGDRLAVGSVLDATGGSQRGAVHLFSGIGSDFSGLTWKKKLASGQGAGLMPALTNNDQFGVSVALDGDRLAVAAYVDDTGGTDRGAVHLFTGVGTDFSGLTWSKRLASNSGAVSMPALNNSDQFGISLALSGDRLAVGALGDDTGGPERGAVHLFDGVGTNFSGLTWQRKLASGQGAGSMVAIGDNDRFGRSVALDGDRMVIGADLNDTGGTDRGLVHFFTGLNTLSSLTWRNSISSGSQIGTMPSLGNSDRFGFSVALSGDLMAVGARQDDTGGPDRGAVHLFTGVGTDYAGLKWQKKLASGQGAIGMPTLADTDSLGTAVSIDGDRMAVGAYGDDTGASSAGAVHLFTGVGTNFAGLTWKKTLASGQGATSMPSLAFEDLFGNAVSLDGDRLAVGAYLDDTGGFDRGAVHLFNGVGTDFSGLTWQKKLATGQSAIGMPVLTNQDYFGHSVSLDGDRLAVGLLRDGGITATRGSAFLFTGVGSDFSGLTYQKKLASAQGAVNMPTLALGDFFGVAVALDGDKLVVGAQEDDAGGTDRGAVHVFTGVGTNFSGLTWQKKIVSGNGAVGMSALANQDYFGVSLALDGDRLAVGAHSDDTGGTDRGAVHLFSGVGSDFSGLTYQKKLASGQGAGMVLSDNDEFSVIALDGDRMAVGAAHDSKAGSLRGAVHLFSGVGTDFSALTWRKKLGSGSGAIGMPTLPDGASFGSGVSLDGDRLAIGAHYEDFGGTDRGAVYLFNGVGSDFSGLAYRTKLASGTGAVTMPVLSDSDFFGFSVALNGDRLAVGAIGDDTGGAARGAVHLFSGVGTDFSGLSWQKKLASSSGATAMPVLANDDWFGASVSIDGDRLAVGALRDSTGGTWRGAVHLYNGVGSNFSGLTWQKKLSSGSGAVGMPALVDQDHFGVGVSIDGNRLAVGAYGDDTGGLDRGAAYVFGGVGTDFSGLTLETKFASTTGPTNMPALSNSDFFGRSVALDGDRLAVGAHGDDTGGTMRGKVYFFNGIGSSPTALNWQKKVASSEGAGFSYGNGDLFGHSVALNGDRLVVGAPGDDTGGADRGAVHLFTGVGADFSGLAWQRKVASGIGASNMPALSNSDQLGWSVALDGDLLAISAPGDDTSGSQRGGVHLFNGVGSNFSGLTWKAKLASAQGASGMPSLADGDFFGSSLALDSGRLAVGAVGNDIGGSDRGAVYLFNNSGSDFSGLSWKKTLASAIGAIGMTALVNSDSFGVSVALDGDRIAVGAYGDSSAGANRGAVYLFNGVGSDFSDLALRRKLGSGLGAAGMPTLADNDRFGSSVAVDGGRLAVGGWGDDTGGTNRGAVHLFSNVGSDYSGLTFNIKLASGQGASGMTALANNDNFGGQTGVSLDGDRLAVGANHGTLDAPGAVYLFSGLTGLGGDSTDVATFASNQTATSYVTPLSIGALLNSGTAVTLQANNDITVSSSIATANPSGNGGALTLQAGRSVLLNANITTDDGNLTVVANSPVADGVVNSERDAGAAAITMGAGTSINAGTGTASFTIKTGGGLTNSTSGDISLRAVSGGSVTASNQGPTASSFVNLNGNVNSGTLSLASTNGGILQLGGAVTATGATSLSSGSGYNVQLSGSNNFGGPVSLSVGNHATLNDINGIDFSNSTVGGNLSLTVAGPVSDSGSLTVTGTTSLTAGAANNITLDSSANDFGGAVSIVSANNVRLTDANAVDLGTSTISGYLEVLAGGNITQSGQLSVAGDLWALTAAGHVLLHSYTNTLGGTVSLRAPLSNGVSGAGGDVKLKANSIKVGKLRPSDGSATTVGISGARVTIEAPTGSAILADGTQGLITADQPYAAATYALSILADGVIGNPATANPTVEGLRVQTNGLLKVVSDGASAGTVMLVGDNAYQPRYEFAGDATRRVVKYNGVIASLPPVPVTSTQSVADTANAVIQSTLATSQISVASTQSSGSLTSGSGTAPATTFSPTTTSTSSATTPVSDSGSNTSASATTASSGTTGSSTQVSGGSTAAGTTGVSSGGTTDTQVSSGTTAGSTSTPATNSDLPSTGTGTATSSGTTAGSGSETGAGSTTVAQATTGGTTAGNVTSSESGASTTADSPTQRQGAAGSQRASSADGGRKTSAGDERGAALQAASHVQALSAAMERRQEVKVAALSGAIEALRQNPSAADLPECGGGEGLCIAARRPAPRAPVVVPPTARLPQIERKIALVLGVEDYSGPIPSLKTPGRDIDALSKAYDDKLGYDVRKLKNPSKADIVREFNRVISEAHESDSVMIYYAGHGYVLDETKTGYWIPADGSAKSPENWISNRDITRMLNNISAKQVMLVSDSCFSGRLAEGAPPGAPAPGTAPVDILQKRSVVVLSSGGDEPVADQGREGHSIFAHHLLKSMNTIGNVVSGKDLFETVRTEVSKEFPQQPQYAPVVAAGHEPGGEFLFEMRERGGR